MKNEWKKVLEWLKNHKLVYVLVGVLALLALYCSVFSPLIDHALGLDEETMDSGITVGERATGAIHVSPEEAQSMECYLEYYRPDSILYGEYATGEWQSRVVYRDNGTTFYEEDNDWCETEVETIVETILEETGAIPLESDVTIIEDKTETTNQQTTEIQGTEATLYTTAAVPTSTIASTTIQAVTVTQPESSKSNPTEEIVVVDPFEAAGWTKTKEDAFFKYYQNETWNISWCFKDYGGGDFDEVMIYEYLGKETQVAVPAMIAGKKVTALYNTFQDSKIHFSNILIPASIREMYGTFGRAYYVDKITINSGSELSFVDDRAFGGTHKGGDNWDVLSTIVCEKSVEEIIVDDYYVHSSDFIFERIQ